MQKFRRICLYFSTCIPSAPRSLTIIYYLNKNKVIWLVNDFLHQRSFCFKNRIYIFTRELCEVMVMDVFHTYTDNCMKSL